MSNVAQAVLNQQKKRADQSQFVTTDLTKYFTIALDKNVSSGEKIFRMLPPKNAEDSPFTEVYFHVVDVEGTSRKLWDPAKNEKKPSPLTELYNRLRASGDPDDKNLSKKFNSRLFYIIKGIERGKEAEGVKFWRFPHDSKGTGIFDQLVTIFKKYGDITDILTGCDLCINLTKAKDPRSGKEYTTITSILPERPSPLSTNPDLQKTWLDDTMTWENVYKKYDTEYLQIIAEGDVPTWSEAAGKWVAKSTAPETEESGTNENMSGGINTHAPENDPFSNNVVPESTIPEDDLPF